MVLFGDPVEFADSRLDRLPRPKLVVAHKARVIGNVGE
jgi:hypothetical protein